MEKVSAGQPLQIPASTFNTMIDAALDYQRRTLNRESDPPSHDTKNGIVVVRNQSGADRNRFTVMALTNVLVTPTQNQLEFASRWAFDADLVAANHKGKFVVLQEPIRSGFLGKALIVGVTPVNLKRLTGETSEIAGIVAGQIFLQAGLPGAQILWEDTFTAENVHLALVRMPGYTDQSPIRMRVTSVQTSYLICQRWTGSAWSANNENVAKPYLLRATIVSRNGVTYTYSNGFTRTATQGANSETQVIVPSYYTSGDEIYAVPVESTGVTVSGTELKLIDINADGRAWARSNP